MRQRCDSSPNPDDRLLYTLLGFSFMQAPVSWLSLAPFDISPDFRRSSGWQAYPNIHLLTISYLILLPIYRPCEIVLIHGLAIGHFMHV